MIYLVNKLWYSIRQLVLFFQICIHSVGVKPSFFFERCYRLARFSSEELPDPAVIRKKTLSTSWTFLPPSAPTTTRRRISEISSKLWNSPSFKSLTCMSGLCHLCFCFAPWTAHNALCFKMTAASKKSTISFPGFSLLLRSNGHVSSNNTVVCGVPQDFFLGPLLFLLYINDLFHSSKYLSFILFADDADIFFSSSRLGYFSKYV